MMLALDLAPTRRCSGAVSARASTILSNSVALLRHFLHIDAQACTFHSFSALTNQAGREVHSNFAGLSVRFSVELDVIRKGDAKSPTCRSAT